MKIWKVDFARGPGPVVVVTGDRHMLRLRRFEGSAIIRLADFLRMFPPETLRPVLTAR